MPRQGPELLRQIGHIARATVFPENLADNRRQFVVIYAVRLLFLVGRRLWTDRMPRQAAALAFQTMLSLVPLVAIAVAVASTLELGWLEHRLVAFLETQLVPEAASDVGARVVELAAAVRPRTLGLVGGASLVLIAVMLLFNVEAVVNDVFRVRRSRRLWLRAATALVLLVAAPLAIGVSVYFTSRLITLPRFAAAMVPLLMTMITLFLCYWRLPHTPTTIRHSLVAAAVAGLGLELFKWGFALYVSHLAGTISAVYGTLAILPLFMVWIYLMWLIFLFGAELSAALHEVQRHDRFHQPRADLTNRTGT
jgi:membrane protein